MKIKRDQTKYQEANISLLLFIRAKARAKEKGLEFTITKEDIIIPEICPILGCKITIARGKGRRKDGASLDRIDNFKGYIKGNVWIVSDLANRMKQDATVEELKLFGSWCNTL